jgi:hypothetical protein
MTGYWILFSGDGSCEWQKVIVDFSVSIALLFLQLQKAMPFHSDAYVLWLCFLHALDVTLICKPHSVPLSPKSAQHVLFR